MATLPAITDPVVIDGTTQPGYAGTPLIHIEGLGISRSLDITGGGTTVKGLSFTSNSAGASNGIIRLSGAGNNIITGCAFGVRGDSTRPSTSSIGILIESNGNRVGGTTAAERNYFAVTNEANLVIQNGAANNRVTGNWFGTGPNGTRMESNGRDMIRILNSPNNTIGGSTGTTPGGACTGECNVIAGGGNNGIFINGSSATGNRVVGSFIGLFAAGNIVNANNIGIRIENAPGNTVGGTTVAERNVITGNSGLAGVMVTGAGSTGTVVTGNYIGLFSSGSSAPASGNTLDGILLNASSTGTRIGGTTAGERNVISGLAGNGIEIAASHGNSVLGNYIGTDASGMARSTTVSNGILIAFSDNNTIGGTQGTTLGGACTGACNVISGNGNNGTNDGILLNTANNNTIDGCYIGLNAAGTAAMLNGRTPDGSVYNGHAIALYTANDNLIGRQTAGKMARPDRAIAEQPETVYCLQDPKNGNYISFTDQPGILTYEAKNCVSGRTVTGLGSVHLFMGAANLHSDAIGNTGVDAGLGPDWGWGVAHFPDPDGFSMQITREPPYTGSCECPTAGIMTIGGPLQLGSSGEPAHRTRVSRAILGKKANGSALNSLFPTRSFIRNLFGSDNIFENLEIDSGDDDSISIEKGNGNAINNVQFQTTGDPIHVAPAGNGNLQPPSPMVFTRFGLPGIGMSMTAEFTGMANQTYEIRIYGGRYVTVNGALVAEYIPTGISLTVTTDFLGQASISTTFMDQEFDTLIRQENLTATATLVANGSTSSMTSQVHVPKPLYDFDEDGKTDFSVYRPGPMMGDPSTWYIQQSLDHSIRAIQFGSSGDAITPGYFNGDLKTDFSVFRPSTGYWFIARQNGNPANNFESLPFGVPTDIPIRNFDYDGDRRADPAVFRPANGTWYIRGSIGGYTYGRQWGVSTDVLAPADYNGDGKSDLGVFRSGTWYINTCPNCPPIITQFGLNGDLPVPGDFDGDGQADIAVWRPADGNWYINRTKLGFAAFHWGSSGDIPLNIDIDADGKNDLGVWRPSTGDWWVLQSGNGQPIGYHWGQNGDVPVPRF